MTKQTFKEWLKSGVKNFKTNWKEDRVSIKFIFKTLTIILFSATFISIGITSIIESWYIGGLLIIPGALGMLYSFYLLDT
jgi:hypothetical protein